MQVGDALHEIEIASRAKSDHLRVVSQEFSKSFDALAAVYGLEHGPAVQEDEKLKRDLGPDMLPKTGDDVDKILRVFAQCLTMARSRTTHDISGREVGPGSGSTVYVRSFLVGYPQNIFVTKQTLLEEAFETASDGEVARTDIIQIEKLVRSWRHSRGARATRDTTLGRSKSVPCALCFVSRRSVSAECAQKSHAQLPKSIVEQVHLLQATRDQLQAAVRQPNTATYLAECFLWQKQDTKISLEALPPFALADRGKEAASTRGPVNGKYDQLELQQIEEALTASEPLSQILTDREAMETIRSVYGDAMEIKLLSKGSGIHSAREEASLLRDKRAKRQQLAASTPTRLRIKVLTAKQVTLTTTDANGYEVKKRSLQRLTASFGGAGQSNGIAFGNREFAGEGATADLLCLASCAVLHVGDIRLFVTGHYIGQRSVPLLEQNQDSYPILVMRL